jgi:hypothetical protein
MRADHAARGDSTVWKNELLNLLLKYTRSWEDTIWMLRTPSVMAPFIIFAAIQFLVLVCLGLFHVPPLATLMVPVVELLGGDQALHYPMHLILLPRMYHIVYLPLVVIAGFGLFGWAVSLMVEHHERAGVEIDRRQRRSVKSLLPSLTVLGIVYVVFVTGLQLLASSLAAVIANSKAASVVSIAGVAVVVVVQSLIVYSVYFLVVRTANPVKAVSASVSFGRRHLGLTSLIVFTVFLIHLPIDYLAQRADRVVLKFDPGLVFVLLAVGIVVEIATSYFLFAATTSVAAGGRPEELG